MSDKEMDLLKQPDIMDLPSALLRGPTQQSVVGPVPSAARVYVPKVWAQPTRDGIFFSQAELHILLPALSHRVPHFVLPLALPYRWFQVVPETQPSAVVKWYETCAKTVTDDPALTVG
jgi:hypothetical protein